MRSYAVGLPGLAVLAVGFFAFLLAVLVARARRGNANQGPQRRSRRSIAGIAVQCLAFFATSFGTSGALLDPLSPLALGEAAGIALLTAASVALFSWAARTMGRNWSVVARTRSDHELVTTGPFAYVRHPIYSAMALLLLALAVGLGNEWRLIVTLPLYALGTWLRIVEEEKLLSVAFGADYDAYAGRVRRVVPGLL